MDPLTALSLAGNIVQFIDIASKILRGSHYLYHSTTGALPVNQDLELRTRSLSEIALKLGQPIPTLQDLGAVPTSAKSSVSPALRELCEECRIVAEQLIERLDGLKVEGKHRIWKSFKHAIKAAWAQREVDELSYRLSGFRKSLNDHVLAELRDTSSLVAIQQSERFAELDEKTRNILVALLDLRDTNAQDIKEQTVAVAQMLSRTEVILTEQHDKTRALVIDAIQVAFLLGKAKGATVAEVEHAVTVREEEEKLERLVQERILEALHFRTITDRQETITEAYKNTFSWLFRPDTDSPRLVTWSNFTTWLRSGDSTYWINGKAGSGKSTLMRYICENEETKRELRVWAGSDPLSICNFFFWNDGTTEQKSYTGLLRSLLYDVLRQHPSLIPIIMPAVWARTYSQTLQGAKRVVFERLTLQFLTKSLKRLVAQKLVKLKLCLFIDGLDEYEGDARDMAELFTSTLKSDNIKICVSSRPLVPFEVAFESSSMLRLQDLTFEDIKLYVADKLHANDRFQRLADIEGPRALNLVNELVAKADGVFLWVVLVVRSILVGLSHRDEMALLERRLRELPSDLSALFENMLTKRIGPFYQKEASKLFQIVRASRERNDQIERFLEVPSPLTLLALALTHETEPNLAMEAPIQPLTEIQISILCNTMEDRLKNCCAGLLEVQGARDGEPDVSRMEIAKPDNRVQYLHRTVKDYLEQQSVWQTIIVHTSDSDFDPNIVLLKSCVRQLKASQHDENKLVPDSTWRCVALGLEFARQAEIVDNPAYIALLDELDFVMSWILEQLQYIYPSHWAAYYETGRERPSKWQDTSLAVAVEYGLCMYLDYKFRQAGEKPCEKPGRPLLDYAVSQSPREQRYPISPKVVEVLLRHGAEPNKAYNSQTDQATTPWGNALAYVYNLQYPIQPSNGILDRERWNRYENERKQKPAREEVISLVKLFQNFVNYGADLNESCNVQVMHYTDTKIERRPVLYIVNDVFVRWYPEESADLEADLKRRGAGMEVMSEFTVYRTLAWKRAREIRVKFW